MSFQDFVREQAELAHRYNLRVNFDGSEDKSLLRAIPVFSEQEDSAIEQALFRTLEQYERLKSARIGILLGLLAAIVAVGYFTSSPFAFIVSLFTSLFAFGFFVLSRLEKMDSLMRHGQTLEEASRCEDVLKMAQEYPAVAAYVAEVTKNRRLYRFDFAVCDGLSAYCRIEHKRAEKAQRNKEACVVLHSGLVNS